MVLAHRQQCLGSKQRQQPSAPCAAARRVAPVRTTRPSRARVVAPLNVSTPARQPAPKLSDPSDEGQPISVYHSMDATTKSSLRPRVVVLGSGWGAMSFMKSLPKNVSEKYDIVVVSPRNYFLYTPLLPAVATGTMEERSIVEPVRNFVKGKGEYYEAVCKDIDPVKKELVCCFPDDAGMAEACFKVSYDICIVSVGSVNNTFGIKGVDKYCYYFKSIEDANALRRRISECFERAALPGTPEEERKKLLSFVIVGGGPTGVEVAAEMYDMIHDDLRKLYPALIKDVQIQIIELMDHVLSTYDRAISIYTADQFKRTGVKLVLNSRVASVEDGLVRVVNKANETSEIRFGACVWATGVAMNPLIKMLQEKLPGQSHFRSILTDDYMRVKGSNGSIFAIGDAATIDQPKALDYAEELFEKGDLNHDNLLSLEELRKLLVVASQEFPHLREHANFLDSRQGVNRFGNLVLRTLTKASDENTPLAQLGEGSEISKEQFKELLGKVDKGLRALPATAQVAKQQGDFLAELFVNNLVTGEAERPIKGESFRYSHKGSAAYIGSDKAVFDVPKLGPLTGLAAGFMWKGFETYSQFSVRNVCLVSLDWLRTKIFGRDISRV